MAFSDMLLPEFDLEMANTRKVLERVPDDKFDWRPHAKSFTMGELAGHLANMTSWITLSLTADSFDVMPDGVPRRQQPYASAAAILEAFDSSVAQARALLASTTDEQYLQPWSLLGNGKPFFTLPRLSMLRTMVFNHIIHHRGQLTIYLRMNDMPLPQLYGPTADEPM